MSTDDLNSRGAARGKKEPAPAGSSDRKTLPHDAPGDQEQITVPPSLPSPAFLRLSALLLAFVLLLVVLGWAIGKIL